MPKTSINNFYFPFKTSCEDAAEGEFRSSCCEIVSEAASKLQCHTDIGEKEGFRVPEILCKSGSDFIFCDSFL